MLRHSRGHVVSESRVSFAFVLRKLSLSEVNYVCNLPTVHRLEGSLVYNKLSILVP